jgi:hypothetical protein
VDSLRPRESLDGLHVTLPTGLSFAAWGWLAIAVGFGVAAVLASLYLLRSVGPAAAAVGAVMLGGAAVGALVVAGLRGVRLGQEAVFGPAGIRIGDPAEPGFRRISWSGVRAAAADMGSLVLLDVDGKMVADVPVGMIAEWEIEALAARVTELAARYGEAAPPAAIDPRLEWIRAHAARDGG